MSFAANIPHFYALVRNQYLYDLQTGQGETTACLVFAVDSVEGHATGFDILTEWGGQFARLPIHALCWRTDAPERPLHQLQLWNNFSYSVEAVEYMALRQLTCAARIDDEDDEWLQGEYMFTLSWFGSQYAEQPGEGGFKRAHMIKLDEGNYALQPNNRMKWYEPSFVTKPFPDHPDFVTNSRVWNAEHRDEPWATEDSPTYYYKEQGGAFYKPAPQAPIKAAELLGVLGYAWNGAEWVSAHANPSSHWAHEEYRRQQAYNLYVKTFYNAAKDPTPTSSEAVATLLRHQYSWNGVEWVHSPELYTGPSKK